MRYFVCLLDSEGQGISEEVRRPYESLPHKRHLESRWDCGLGAAVLTAWDDNWGDTLVACHGDWLAAGVVRLDNRTDVERWAGEAGGGLTDLELILRVVARHGERYVGRILGDFAFIAWNGPNQTGLAACDAFAVRKLYFRRSSGIIALASRAESLALAERYETRYLAELLTHHLAPTDISVYADVLPLPPASLAVLHDGKLTIRRYWSISDIVPERVTSEQETVARCRQLMCESVRLRFGDTNNTWAELSGGLDSSSIVCLAQWLAERGELSEGLAGTVSIVGVPDTGTDERKYSEAVVRRWRVRNHTIINPPAWQDGDARSGPPHLDQPVFDIVCAPRDRRMCATIRSAGGRVLLTGWGGDELFTGNMLFFADRLARREFRVGIREMARRAAIGRVSLWELMYKNALLPMAPRVLQRRLVRDERAAQPWLHKGTLRRFGLDPRESVLVPEFCGRLGEKYRWAVRSKMEGLPRLCSQGLVADVLDVRHPMLYRPLVEFALQLPPEMRARPYAHRWVVREALRGILPELVRTRVGKGGTGEVVAQALGVHRAQLASMLRDPILAQLGLVNAEALRAAFDGTAFRTSTRQSVHGEVLGTLAVEAWLQIRAGRWPWGGHVQSQEAGYGAGLIAQTMGANRRKV